MSFPLPLRKVLVEKYLNAELTFEEAIGEARCSRGTFYAWIKKSKEENSNQSSTVRSSFSSEKNEHKSIDERIIELYKKGIRAPEIAIQLRIPVYDIEKILGAHRRNTQGEKTDTIENSNNSYGNNSKPISHNVNAYKHPIGKHRFDSSIYQMQAYVSNALAEVYRKIEDLERRIEGE